MTTFMCPRCGEITEAWIYGPCGSCRVALNRWAKWRPLFGRALREFGRQQ